MVVVGDGRIGRERVRRLAEPKRVERYGVWLLAQPPCRHIELMLHCEAPGSYTCRLDGRERTAPGLYPTYIPPAPSVIASIQSSGAV